MKLYSCKCGVKKEGGKIPPPSCVGCSNCGSKLSDVKQFRTAVKKHSITHVRKQINKVRKRYYFCSMCKTPKDELIIPVIKEEDIPF